ncbi:nuclease-related domain-containing protein [Gracilibacillus sp. D59]|uniref:nuclease-related domain-containing protein n=1 Tax=Gracilibacillus sp. D59 TaxID=3457434 RepID=UPI003FCCCD07
MMLKERKKPLELQLYDVLSKRKELSNAERKKYQRLRRGYEGECVFDSFVDAQTGSFYVLHDLQLIFYEKFFQIDSVIITNNTMYIFEVKNYLGEYYFNNDALCMGENIEVENPIHQRNRSESLVRRFLQYHGFSLTVKAYIIFMHPQCTVYQTPSHKQILFRSNLQSFLQKLSTNSYITQQDMQLSELLLSSHVTKHPFEQFPSYQIKELRKGIICKECESFSISIINKTVFCQTCQNKELVELTILRHIREYLLLTSTNKVTTNDIYQWCDRAVSEKRIIRVLHKYYKKQNDQRHTYFEKCDGGN